MSFRVLLLSYFSAGLVIGKTRDNISGKYLRNRSAQALIIDRKSTVRRLVLKFGVWLSEAKVSCSFCHQGAQMILAYSWARPAVVAAGKGRGGMLLFLLFISIYLFLPYLSLSPPLLSLLSLFSLSLADDTK